MFEGREKFLDGICRKGGKLGKKMVYEKKAQKYLKEPQS
jgi:hypothetical protein